MSVSFENPVVNLACRRSPSGSMPVWLTALAAAAGLWLPYPEPRWILAIVLAGAFPLSVACLQAAVLARLREGRGLELLMVSPTSARETVDGLAGLAVRTVVDRWPWLGGFSLVLVCALGDRAHPEAAPVVLWMLLVLAGLSSYVSQCGYAWSAGEDDFRLRPWIALALTPMAAGLAGGVHLGLSARPVAGALLFLASGLCLAGISRRLAIEGLERFEEVCQRLQGWCPAPQGPRSGLPIPWSGNPVVFRESRSAARHGPAGLAGQLLWQHGLGFLVVVLLGELVRGPEELWGALVVMMALQSVRAAYRTVGAVVDERTGGTLECLLLAPLKARQWADGWALVGAWPRAMELLAWIGFLAWTAVALSPWRLALCAALLVGFTVASAYAGLAVSACSRDRTEANDRIGLELCKLWTLAILGLLLSCLGSAPAACLGVVCVLATAAEWRRGVLRYLAGDQPARQLLSSALRRRAPSGHAARVLRRLEEEGLVDQGRPLSPRLGSGSTPAGVTATRYTTSCAICTTTSTRSGSWGITMPPSPPAQVPSSCADPVARQASATQEAEVPSR
ncbi:MAG: hypothetical protein HY319_05845 [Armatimonadetes bacterium]|nr:hypothetical protein [Armatimonadota bacterium]